MTCSLLGAGPGPTTQNPLLACSCVSPHMRASVFWSFLSKLLQMIVWGPVPKHPHPPHHF